MSGYGISHSDAGGYTTVMHMKRSKELLIRWEEMNAFSPLLRTHEGNQPVNDVQFDDDQDLLRNMNRAAHWHVLLKDYLQQLVRECKESGIPVMRPLFYHYDEAWCYTEKTEYLLGGELLIAPILEDGKRSRLVRLPDDHWIHLFTGERFQGGDLEIEASIEEIPVFVRDSEEGRKIVELFRK
jgi:alpha-glucosidase